jgi:hypothetical protein
VVALGVVTEMVLFRFFDAPKNQIRNFSSATTPTPPFIKMLLSRKSQHPAVFFLTIKLNH